jgi:hypothetical protein
VGYGGIVVAGAAVSGVIGDVTGVEKAAGGEV